MATRNRIKVTVTSSSISSFMCLLSLQLFTPVLKWNQKLLILGFHSGQVFVHDNSPNALNYLAENVDETTAAGRGPKWRIGLSTSFSTIPSRCSSSFKKWWRKYKAQLTEEKRRLVAPHSSNKIDKMLPFGGVLPVTVIRRPNAEAPPSCET